MTRGSPRARARTSAAAVALLFVGMSCPTGLGSAEKPAKADAAKEAEFRRDLKQVAHKIVFETYRKGNWELYMTDADGSGPVNLTRTSDVDELYPHVSPDGSRICFVADEGREKSRIRSVYYMNLDSLRRTLVARNARQPCWGPDGTVIAYLKGEFDSFCYKDFATKGLFFYDLKTGKHTEHPNGKIHHLYNICWSPDGKWFLATVHGGMGYGHAILAIEAEGTKVFNLGIGGCRPDISPDGKKVAWGPNDWVLRVGDLDLAGPKPAVKNQRDIVKSTKPIKIYHVDWSPDGRHVAFSRGPTGKRLGHAAEIVGIRAEGWNICVADAGGTNRWAPVTSDGLCNKEPDWVPVRKSGR